LGCGRHRRNCGSASAPRQARPAKAATVPRSCAIPPRQNSIAAPYDLSAEDNARRVIGGKLAAGAITAEVRLDPSGRWLPVPAHYWGSDAADVTMKSGEMDLHVVALAMGIDLGAGLFKAEVFLAVDKVVAALGFSLAPLEGTPAPARSAPAATPPDARDPFGVLRIRPAGRGVLRA
jgi:hypothetical protein